MMAGGGGLDGSEEVCESSGVERNGSGGGWGAGIGTELALLGPVCSMRWRLVG